MLYLAVVAPFLLVPLALAGFGVDPEIGLSFSVLLAIAFSISATVYIVRNYRATPKPRSVFFGMLVSALIVKQAFAGWIGWLVAATLLARPDTLGIQLPIPDQPTRALINAVAVIVLLVTAIYYALSIAAEVRRRTQNGHTLTVDA